MGTSLSSLAHSICTRLSGKSPSFFALCHLYNVFIFSFERKHQFGKMVTRFSKNFVNPAVTIHSKHQKRRALWVESSHYEKQNFFAEEENSQPKVLSSLPPNCTLLPASRHPFSTKKNILRKLSSRHDLYFQATAFHEDPSNGLIVCSGSIWRKRMVQINGRNVFSRANETLYELEKVYPIEKHLRLEDVHYANDYIFVHDNSSYLLEWIG